MGGAGEHNSNKTQDTPLGGCSRQIRTWLCGWLIDLTRGRHIRHWVYIWSCLPSLSSPLFKKTYVVRAKHDAMGWVCREAVADGCVWGGFFCGEM